MAGEGPAYGSLRRDVAARGLVDYVMFVGHLDRRKALLDCYRAADLLAFASNTQTQGLVPLEAMAVGIPVMLAVSSLSMRSSLRPGLHADATG